MTASIGAAYVTKAKRQLAHGVADRHAIAKMANHDSHQTGAVGAGLAMHQNRKFHFLKQILDRLKLGAGGRGARAQPQIRKLDAVTRTRLLLKPARTEGLIVAPEVDNGFNSAFRRPCDVMRRRCAERQTSLETRWRLL